ncbi:tetratricopeptide repeat protein [candidate division KSB1 bacterium]|nr:MAG: tetratricopeptide repeat protein [candidate division KSB1 bacterium]
MSVNYEVKIEPTSDEKSFRITWINVATQQENSFDQSADDIDREEIARYWLQVKHQLPIGNQLFCFLAGKEGYLHRALDEAAKQGEPLLLHLRACQSLADLPFELLAQDSNFLLPARIHLIRRVSDWGEQKQLPTADRPLTLLFMACSALDVKPELAFEKEEETIFQVTKNLAIDMEVEDSGSLEGLREKLEREAYDVVHLSGHADIDNNGNPFFIMEDETGYHRQVTPDRLWQEALTENPPRLLFLSGCRTGQTPEGLAASSFAQQLVERYQLPAVLGWGRSVADDQATRAEQIIYHELSRGKDLLAAVMRARQELQQAFQSRSHHAWTMLRLYSGGMPFSTLVKPGQPIRPKARSLAHTFLHNSQVKILTEGFVGRRRQLQQSLRALKHDPTKVGLLLHGAGGLGKSCLAGKICERLGNHTLVIVHGRLDAVTLADALDYGFAAAQDKNGAAILNEKKELSEKLKDLCATSFKEKNYLILLDDFEQNIQGAKEGNPGDLAPEALPLLQILLHYLPLAGKQSQLLITSRYHFDVMLQSRDLANERLERISLTSFRDAELEKKAQELSHIFRYFYQDFDTAQKLLLAGHGNPRLLEWIDTLVGDMPQAQVPQLLTAVQHKQQEFIQQHVIHQLLERAGTEAERFLCWFSVFRLPVGLAGARLIGERAGLDDWQSLLTRAVHLTLAEYDRARDCYAVSPMLETCGRFVTSRRLVGPQAAHEAAFAYYEQVCTERDNIDPVLTEEWIYHALNYGREDVASHQGGRLVTFLRDNLAFLESKRVGEWVLAEKKQPLNNSDDASILNYLAITISDLGEHQKAIIYFERSLEICKNVYGEKHAEVATRLNNLGTAWHELGNYQQAIRYYEQALVIDRTVHGEQHPNVAGNLNNLGGAWWALGDYQKAINYYELALAIDQDVFGTQHANVARDLNNLGIAKKDLGDHKEAISYQEQALAISKAIYGEQHPQVAINLNNLGLVWADLGEHQKAISYYEQAMTIDRAVYGEQHPSVARDLNNLGMAWATLLDYRKAINYYEHALQIVKTIYGEKHPHYATSLNNLGMAWADLSEHQKAIKYLEQAIAIDRTVYGAQHPAVSRDLNNLGEAWRVLGESQKAIGYYEQALSIDQAVYGEQHLNVATDLNNIGLAWQALSEPNKAIDYYMQAIAIDRAVYGEQHPKVATRLNNLGSAHFSLGEKKQAKAYFEAAYKIFLKFFGSDHLKTRSTAEWLAHL